MQGLWESYELSSYVIARRHKACVIGNQKHSGVLGSPFHHILKKEHKHFHTMSHVVTSLLPLLCIFFLLILVSSCSSRLCMKVVCVVELNLTFTLNLPLIEYLHSCKSSLTVVLSPFVTSSFATSGSNCHTKNLQIPVV